MSKRHRLERMVGVYYREHSDRKHNGKPDRCFDITYRTYRDAKDKFVWEKIGWASEGYTAQMAAQVRAERIRALRHGEDLPNRKVKVPTFGELWAKYAEWAKTNRKSFKAETNRYEKHLKAPLGNLPVDNISPFLLEKIKNDVLKAGLSPQTAKHVLVLIRQVLNKGVVLDLWSGPNPVKQVKIPKPNNRRERFLTVEEARRLLDELAKVSPKIRDIALLSLDTGMRAGEIFALKWGHIDIEGGIISILDPKGGQSQKAFMTNTAKEMLVGRAVDVSPDQFVFKDRHGGQIKEVSATFDRAIERLGFNRGIEDRRWRVCFHTLRHTFASWLAVEDTPILTIKELLRHSSLAMTERYSHLIPDHKRQAINVIEAKLNQPSESDTTSSSVQESQTRNG